MTAIHTVKSLPGPNSFYGLKNIRDLGQKGMLAILAQRFAPQLPPGYEAKFVADGILNIRNGLPMILQRR